MTFDAVLSLKTVKLSRLAYHEKGSAETGVEQLGMSGFRWFDRGSTQALLATETDQAFLAFRGTESTNPRDWTTDAKFIPAPGVFGAPVHSGFRDALDDVWPDIITAIAGLSVPVVVTGHSLGAALATLAAARLDDAGHDVAGVYTFGQPRTGQGAFRSAYGERLGPVTFRFINHIDLVTRVPLLIQGYRHVGSRMYFDHNGRFHVDANPWMVAMDDVRFRLAHFGSIKAAGLAPHEISAYVDLIETL